MPITKEEVKAKLTEMGIEFTSIEHGEVYTIDDMKLIPGMKIENVCKNLFLRDEKGKRHFLIVLDEAKTADLKQIRAQIACSRLSFASEERLMKYMGLKKGAVTPLGILNDCAASVEIIFDSSLKGRPVLGFHPCDNTETLWISEPDMQKIILSRKNPFKYIEI